MKEDKNENQYKKHEYEYEDKDGDEDQDDGCEDEEDHEYQEDEEDQDIVLKSVITPTNMHVSSRENFVYPKKRSLSTKSEGVESLNQLPLDWFTKVKKEHQQHKIIPKKNN